MTEPIVVPVKVEAHDHCWHESVRNKKGHGNFATNFMLTIDVLKARLPFFLEKYSFCCFCNQEK
jgi:hypothetical protein